MVSFYCVYFRWQK